MANWQPTASRTFDLSRRHFLAGVGGLALASALPWNRAEALGAASFKQGVYDVTVVSDGHLVLPTKVIAPDAPAEELKPLLDAAGVTKDTIEPATNAVVLKSESDVILFDTGSGTDFQPTAGKLMENLKTAGIDPATITKVAFTHAHPDHAWGTLGKSGELNFPNATYYVTEGEWNFWMDKDILTKMPKEMHPFVLGAQKHLTGIKERMKSVKPGEEIAAGVVVFDTAGHTPGHASFEVAGDGGLIIIGDAAPVPAVHFPNPHWRFGFDGIPDLAIANRKKLLDHAATGKIKMIGFHWPHPGIGHAEKKDTAYRYVPAT